MRRISIRIFAFDSYIRDYSMLRERQQSILDAIIREYIRTARPVASRELARQFQFGVGSATVRNEMQELDEMGYLKQPHTSAGRIPTDKAYRFFVDYLIEDAMLSAAEQRRIDEILEMDEEDMVIKELCRAVSQISGAFAATGAIEDTILYKSGFAEILDEPEFGDTAEVRTFSRLVDFLDEKIGDMRARIDDDEDCVFIGKENPWKEARDYSMAMASWWHPAGFKGFFTIIGPKRMNYPKAISLIHYFEERE